MSHAVASSAQPGDRITDCSATSHDTAFVDQQVRPRLRGLLDEEAARWQRLGAPWHGPTTSLTAYLDGGKMLRPRFCYWGLAAVGGAPNADLVTAGAALELLHAFALIHDDLMDGSARRRGRAALHRAVADEHDRHGWIGSPTQYGTATALLTGDLAFALACRLSATLPAAAGPVWNQLLTELTAGQYLDLTAAARATRSSRLAQTIARLKSGRYTIVGPLRLGAATAGRSLPAGLSAYGDLVGEAFQLRDDLLDLFGDPAVTGKPANEDLQAGKPTLLLAYAHERAHGRDRALLKRVGSGDLTKAEITKIIQVIESTGARARVEARIKDRLNVAHAALTTCALPAPATTALAALANAAANRPH